MKIKKIGASLLALSIMAVGTSTAFAANGKNSDSVAATVISIPATTTTVAMTEINPGSENVMYTKLVASTNSIAATEITPASDKAVKILKLKPSDVKNGMGVTALAPSKQVSFTAIEK